MNYTESILPRRSTTRSIKRILPFLKERSVSLILDYGSGTLRNSNFLIRNGFRIIIVDTKEQLAKIVAKPEMEFIEKAIPKDDVGKEDLNVDAVISNFVLDILSYPEQLKFIKNVSKNLKTDGYFLVEIKKVNKYQKIYHYNLFEQALMDNLIIPLGFNRILTIKNLFSITCFYQKVNNYLNKR